jgi:hypothetical protein
MTGGTRIIAFDSASTNAPGDEFLLTEELSATVAETSPDEPWHEEEPPAETRTRWLIPAIGGAMLVGWTAFFVWAMFDRMIADPLPEHWVEMLRDWAVPVLLVAVAALVLLRNSRREALRFGNAARMLSDESARLDTRLSVVNRELSLAREFIAAQSRDLETLGRLAADRLSAQADRLQALIRENHARVETIGTVSEAALDNMEKLRGQLPVIASSAKDVTNDIGNTGRTAHSQLQEMVAAFAGSTSSARRASARCLSCAGSSRKRSQSSTVRRNSSPTPLKPALRRFRKAARPSARNSTPKRSKRLARSAAALRPWPRNWTRPASGWIATKRKA